MKPSNLPKPQNRHARIEPLSVLPVFLDLHSKLAIVVGESEGALWKAELLLQSGANLKLICQRPGAAVLQLVTDSNGVVELFMGNWRSASFEGAFLVVADVDEHDAQQLAGKAHAAGAFVNIIDKPEFCQFQFGSIVNKSPLVIGISTTGAAPVLAQHVRSLLEAILPVNIQTRAQRAAAIRAKVTARLATPALRRIYWQAFFSKMFGFDNRCKRNSNSPYVIKANSVDELTLRDVRKLQSADRIYLSNPYDPAILNFARREASRHLICSSRDASSYEPDSVLVGTSLEQLQLNIAA
jgi:uroporphyrin-III C-methyltransferase / precorrin-2 dehydrogenase / sirohydrochlorin ferrochelatase